MSCCKDAKEWALLTRHRVEERITEFRNIVKKIDNLIGYVKKGYIVSTLNIYN